MEQSVEVSELANEFLKLLREGDKVRIARLIANGPPTLLIGTAPTDWYEGSDATLTHLQEAIDAYGGVTLVLRSIQAWSEGACGWFAGHVSAVFPSINIPLRLTGVAVSIDDGWQIAQLHLSAAVTDEGLLGG